VRTTLQRGLAIAAEAVAPEADDGAGTDEGLRLDLPQLAVAPPVRDVAMAKTLASLYLAAELEQAGVVPVAELLAENRDTLQVSSFDAAAKLDDFARRAHEWYDRNGRTALYARLFGTGPAATPGAAVNREFQSRLADLCHALARLVDVPAARSTSLVDASVWDAALLLLEQCFPTGSAPSALIASHRLFDQLRRAIDLLRDPAIEAVVGARSMQATIVTILGQDAPDVQRLIDTGLAGQGVLLWLFTVAMPKVADPARPPLAAGGDPIVVTASRWLQASGLAAPATQAQQVAA
jgi:hypothetical protein